MRTIYPGVFDEQLYHMVASANNNEFVYSYNKFGYNPDVDLVEEDIWDFGGNYPYVDTAATMDLVSTSIEDAPGGTGIKLVSIFGLDANWDFVSEDLALNGTTPVTTVNQYTRVYRVRCLQSDEADPNTDLAGDLTTTKLGQTQAFIPAGNTSTKMTMFAVPRNYTGFISSITVSGGPNDDIVADLQVRKNGDIFYTAADAELSNSSIYNIAPMPDYGPIEEMSDIKFKANSVSNPNAECRVNYIINLIENDYLARLAKSFG